MRLRNMRTITPDHKHWIFQGACYFKKKKKKRFFLFKKMLHGLGWGLGGGWRENVREWAKALRD